ncbi:E3 ubiquitin-protein ligase RMA1H1-like [Diospyros lotus]|uniref:E3 ubiquitin-protein ligase RMA1H1-like n=1 Tax=Diospyros lotus TaxID=55363 RepID=UPI00225B964B|nr:E3 ubiquitin-protein ligase RMA1H1-like [Diospyros lotus]XP_052178228.1 E3 ubiquitin-protein ligase RMA1H1-like [Diospyros lotus]
MMAYEHTIQEPAGQFGSDGNVSLKQKWESIPTRTTTSEDGNDDFDCNICLDSAHDPVVTFCGHLYCWPCIYKWLHVQKSSLEPDEDPKCPVCKANVSQSLLVPLYGRGTSKSEAQRPQMDVAAPRRPPASPRPNQQLHSYPLVSHPRPLIHRPQHYSPYPYPYGGDYSSTTGIFSPRVGMFREMVFARMLGNPGSGTSLFPYPHTNGRRRMRRQEMQIDKSLSRVSIFLFCCIILCLLLF